MAKLPLTGIRVIDFSHVWSGPYLTKTLGDWGAEVIKVESIARPDPERGPAKVRGAREGAIVGGYPKGVPGTEPFNQRGRFVEYNRNKYGITLDLSTPEGAKEARALVAVSDAVVENFSVGVMARFGLDYESLRRVRPDIVMISMPGFGNTGPESKYVGYGMTQESTSGLSSITGYPGGYPQETGVFYGDPINALFGAVALTWALWRRRHTGRGQFIDVSQREAVSHLVPEVVLTYQMTGRILESVGNRHPAMSPHGCYPCAGEDNWLVISVSSDEMWQALCEAMGRMDLAQDARLETLLGRRRHEDELDATISGWTRRHNHYEAMHLLQSHGVAAEAVAKGAELLEDPHYKARGYFQMSEVPGAGPYPTHGMSWKLSDTQGEVRLPSPRLGEHNHLILGELLGLPQERIADLEARRIIGTVPAVDRA
ncbi:MAG: CoA transferase [Chloroflexota bacterium]|nr:CoA transferase [Chloroflexota bacterium]